MFEGFLVEFRHENAEEERLVAKEEGNSNYIAKEGYSYRAVAAKIGCGVTASAVRKLWKRYEETGSVETQAGRGRHKATTETTDRRIFRLSLNDRKLTAKKINAVLADVGVSVSDRTIRRRLVGARLRARIPRKKPFLSVSQRQKRLQWAKEHSSWTVDQWKAGIWSDESRISIFGSGGAYYVRRRPGKECLPACLTPTMKHPLGVMVWG